MSNLSDIGFRVETEEELNELVEKIFPLGREIKCPRGTYLKVSDNSGAEIYLQVNKRKELIGFNPHYVGKSNRVVCLTAKYERFESELDGAFHGWAEPQEENNPDTGEYPFVFDVPNFYTIGEIKFPANFNIQLTAFASRGFEIYENEEAYYASQDSEFRYASRSFIPSGLFSFSEGEVEHTNPPESHGIFTGEIKRWEIKKNQITSEAFYWFLVDTLGGEVDVVADTNLITNEPKTGGIIQGQFWLTGKLINPPTNTESRGGLFGKLFGH